MAASKFIVLSIVLLSVAALIAGCGSDTVAPTTNNQEAPLLPPQNVVTARSDNGDILITWEPNTQSNLMGYNVYRSDFGSDVFTKLNTSVVTQTQFTDATTQPNKRYSYRVACVSTKGTESNYTSVVIFNGINSNTDKHKKFGF